MYKKLKKKSEFLSILSNIPLQRNRLPWIVQSWCQPVILNRWWNWCWYCSHWYITNYAKGLLTGMVHPHHLLTFQGLFWAFLHHLCLFQENTIINSYTLHMVRSDSNKTELTTITIKKSIKFFKILHVPPVKWNTALVLCVNYHYNVCCILRWKFPANPQVGRGDWKIDNKFTHLLTIYSSINKQINK